jgi:hypothetical protein
MKRSYLIVAAAVVALVVVWFVWRRSGGAEIAIDLVQQFPSADKRSTGALEQVFGVQDTAIKGETKHCVYIHPTSRLTYKITVPEDGRLRAWFAVKEETWDKPSDGVLFRVGVSDGREYEELVTQHVDPANNPSDRRWVPVDVDLAAYAGQQIDLIFNTNTSPKGRGDNAAYDWAVIGEPAIIVQK